MTMPVASNQLDNRQYKIVVEFAGQDTEGFNGWLELSQGPIINGQYLAMLSQAHLSEHRLQLAFLGLKNQPYSLWLAIGSSNSYNGSYYIPLNNQIHPVAHGVEKPEWDNILVPFVPLCNQDNDPQQAAKMLPTGWLTLFVDGHLWRELQIINELGAMRDVDLAIQAGKDQRIATCHVQPHVLVPYKLSGRTVEIGLLFSSKQISWSLISQLGGINSQDSRFNNVVKRQSQFDKTNPAMQKKLLQRIDLTAYQNGFMGSANTVPIDTCPKIATKSQPGSDLLKAFRKTRIPAIFVRLLRAV